MSISRLCDPAFNETLLSLEQQAASDRFSTLAEYSFYHPYLSSLISAVGVLGNLTLFVVLTRPSMLRHGGHGSVHAILAAIAVADFFTNLTNLVYLLCRLAMAESCDVLSSFAYAWNLFVLVHADCSVFLHTLSLYLTVALALLRVLVLCYHSQRWLNDIPAGQWSIFITALFVFAVSLPNFLRNTILVYPKEMDPTLRCSNGNMTRAYDRMLPEAWNSSYVAYHIGTPDWWSCELEKFSFWTNGVMCKIIPCLSLTIFMAALLQIIFVAQQRRRRLLTSSSAAADSSTTSSGSGSDRTTALLVSIVFIFWVTEVPQGMLLILSAYDPSMFTIYQLFGDSLDLLSLINSSVNFALYCSMSAKFRREFVSLLTCNSGAGSSSPTRINASTAGVKKRYAIALNAAPSNAKACNRENGDDNLLSTSLLQKTPAAS